jgi:peptide-methionine (S)-S-oxide reductase
VLLQSGLKVLQIDDEQMKKITLGAGCFWCVEAVFQRLSGVQEVVSGYTGGAIANPTYKEVCSGKTGHAEVVQVSYDESKISLENILEVFFKTHDPTTLNRQGNDVGSQYRSAIFYHDDEQRETAVRVIEALVQSEAFDKPIVTEVVPIKNFYKAEDYHQNYFEQNGQQPYCDMVIKPKLEKFEKAFAPSLK